MPSIVADDGDQPAALEQTLAQLVAASKQTSKARSHPIGPLLSEVASKAYDNGLDASQLAIVVDLVRKPSYLDQSSITNLIKGLYPAGRVSPAVVFDVVSSIGQGATKPSPATQNLLLRWLILVKEALNDESSLTKCYMALFNQLSAIGTRQPLCHLLALITKRRHVKPWRIQMLREHLRNAVSEPGLLGLLQVYKEFYPDIIVDHTVIGRPSSFKHPDLEWRDRLRILQESNLQTNENLPSDGSSFRVIRRGAKRSRVAAIPEVHTFRVDETSVSLEELDGVTDFVEKFEKIELPGQMVSALDDPLLQKYVALRDQDSHQRRIDDWLSLFFDAQLQSIVDGEATRKDLGEVLSSVLSYTRYTKVLPTSASIFFSKYFSIWDGKENLDLIIELLGFLPIQSFEGLYDSFLRAFEDAVLDNTQASTTAVLLLYTCLFRNWSFRLLSISDNPPKEILDDLNAHASLLILKILSTDPTVISQLAILTYFSSVALTISHAPTHPHIRILTPAPLTVYLLAFLSPTHSTLSPLASILATYKLAFEATMTPPTPSQPSQSSQTPAPYPRAYVNEFNGFLMDVCNLLWRSRAFNTTDQNALGCLLHPPVVRSLGHYLETLATPQSLQPLFSLSCNPALAALSIAVFREIEDRAINAADGMDIDGGAGTVRVRHAGPVTEKSLAALGAEGGVRVSWVDYRLEVLQWLGEHGVAGVGELMFCTMKLLMGPVGQSQTPSQTPRGR